MKFTFGIGMLLLAGWLGWSMGQRLSPDAIGMAVGMLFGMFAGIPAAIMVLASRRQADQYYQQPQRRPQQSSPPPRIEVNETHNYYVVPTTRSQSNHRQLQGRQ